MLHFLTNLIRETDVVVSAEHQSPDHHSVSTTVVNVFSADMSSLGGQLGVGCLAPPFAIPAGQQAVQAAAVPQPASSSPGALAGTAPGKARSSMNLSMISGR